MVPGKKEGISGAEFLHDAVNHVDFTHPGGPATHREYKVDGQWTSSRTARATMAAPALAAVRAHVTGNIVSTLVKEACLLDAVVDAVVERVTPNWTWCPAPDVHQTFHVRTAFGAVTPELCDLAVHLIALRSAAEARLRQMTKLNVPEVTLITNANLATKKTTVFRISWNLVLAAGRGACIDALKKQPTRTPMISGPPSRDPANGEMNAIVGAKMLAADTGLSRLDAAGLIDLPGQSGKTFKASVGKSTFLDKPGDLHKAYNHLRFLLYVEWRAVDELMQ
ncbi:hypothetical protein ACIQ9P_32035 [Kitasatospora sp. NPDC094019]|uniref:hypothetical protein n=1 Tax=Kitasatospora sp. NPDC094019 TaxID=3364091 RepID=UPI00381F5035